MNINSNANANSDFTKIDNIRAKLINNPSIGNIFDTSMKRDSSSKILYKNISRKTGTGTDRNKNDNVSSDSIQNRNEVIKRNNSNVNISDYMKNSVIKNKIVSKISNSKNNKN